MKSLCLSAVAALVLCFAVPSRAQQAAAPAVPASLSVSAPSGDMTLGGIPHLIIKKLEEAKPAGLVDFAGNIGGGAYVPTWTFHDMAGRNYVEAANIGYRAIQGSKPSLMLMPAAFNVTAISGRVWDFAWARDHVTRSAYPDLFLGITPLIPLDHAQVSALKLNDPKKWLAGVASVRF